MTTKVLQNIHITQKLYVQVKLHLVLRKNTNNDESIHFSRQNSGSRKNWAKKKLLLLNEQEKKIKIRTLCFVAVLQRLIPNNLCKSTIMLL